VPDQIRLVTLYGDRGVAKQRRVAVPTDKEERDSDACESVSRQVSD
jgi:hypothetical protein